MEFDYSEIGTNIRKARKKRGITQEELEYIRGKEERGELFVIRPPKKIEVSKVERDRQRLLAAYRMGRETMKEHMRSLERFLK